MKILGLATCYNRKEKTLDALHKLMEGNKQIEFQFIIVDDNSTDGTRQALEQLEHVKVLTGTGSMFYSGGMRMAIGEALKTQEQYDYCMLFNDDVDFFEGAIENLAKKGSHCIWVGPTCDERGNLTYGGIIKISKFKPRYSIIKAKDPLGAECDTFNANCVLIPWDVFSRLDNIDPVYCHSMGDFDYGFAAGRAGAEIRVSDQFVGKCVDNPVRGGWRDTTLPRKTRLKLKESPKGLPRREWFHYLAKNYSVITAVVYNTLPYLRILCKK